MFKSVQHISITFVITLLLCFTTNINEAHASDLSVWKKISTQIMVDEFFNERPYCGGTEIEAIALNEGHFIYESYAHHPPCGSQYDLHGTISFAPPPEKVIADNELIHLHAEGEMSGYQSCCILLHWFEYVGDCFADTGERVNLNMTSSGDPHEITIPDTDYAEGWDTTVKDKLDIIVSMPEKAIGSECSVVGRGTRGLWMKWVYRMEVEQASDVIISLIYPNGGEYKCDDDIVRDFTITLTNTGSTDDTGIINLSANGLEGAKFVSNPIPYSISANTQKSYHFGMKFPFLMENSDGNVLASLESDIGINHSFKQIDVAVKCAGIDPATHAAIFLMIYIIKAPKH